MKQNNKKQSGRFLGSLDILMVSFGAMIGWGWVVSSGDWITKAGIVGTISGFVLGGIMIYFVGLVYAELSTSIPNGGCFAFTKRAMGRVPSFFSSWMMILGYIGVVCFESCSFPTVISYIFPNFLQGYLYTIVGFDIYATWILTAILFGLIITGINIFGIKTAAVFQNILTIVVAVLGIFLIVSNCCLGDIQNLEGQLFIGGNTKNSIKGIMSIACVAPFFLFGFEVIPEAMPEIRISLKKTGKIMLLSIFLAVTFYALITLSIGFSMSAEDIQFSMNNGGLVAADSIKKIFNSKALSNVLIIGGLCGIVTSWNSFLIGGSRALSTLSKNGMIFSVFAMQSKKNKVPLFSIIFIGLISIISPFFGKQMLIWISNVSSFACIFAYLMVSISFIILRIKDKDLSRPYKVKFGYFVGIISCLLSLFLLILFLIPNTGSTFSIEEFLILGIWLSIGIIMLFINFLFNKNKSYEV